MSDKSPSTKGEIQTQEKVQIPKLFKVILHNDDFTPMDFVVMVLEKVFHKKNAEAQKIMLDVHEKGSGVAGVYTFEIAEMKVMQSQQLARTSKYPLRSSCEEE